VARWLVTASVDEGSGTLSSKQRTAAIPRFRLRAAGPQVGDQVALWRLRSGGGLVAFGTVVAAEPLDTPTVTDPYVVRLGTPSAAERRRSLDAAMPQLAVQFNDLFLDRPVALAQLEGLVPVVIRNLLTPASLTAQQWREMVRVRKVSCEPEWPAAWNIAPGSVVKRKELHTTYGGNPRAVATRSSHTPNTFLFTRYGGADDVAAAQWAEDDLLIAPGHPQWGPGVSEYNIAVLTHLRQGRPLRVFESGQRCCRYVGEFAIDQERPFEGWALTGNDHTFTHPWEQQEIRNQLEVPLFRLRPLEQRALTRDQHRVAPWGKPQRLRLELASNSQFMSSTRAHDTAAPTADSERGSSSELVHRLVSMLENDPEARRLLSRLDEAELLSTLLQQSRRREDLEQLRAVIEDPASKECELQKVLERMIWIFGAEFLATPARRSLTTRDQLDLSLIRPDGTLHGVELKLARVPRLVRKHRNHYIVGHEINEAQGQAENYLCQLDGQRDHILAELGIDCRRASMTIVIGHSAHVPGIDPNDVAEAIRIRNSGITRIRIVTYDAVLSEAERSLVLSKG